jgi:Ca-activated chloride channel family protein
MEKAIFRFAHQEYLWLLVILPVMIAIYIGYVWSKNRAVKKFGDPFLLKELTPDASLGRNHIKFILLLLSIGLIITAIAGPQFGSKIQEVKRKGIEIMIALDVSNSMMARDIEPNRLERAKQAIAKLIDRLENDRLGLIVFAGDAYIQIPITGDYTSAKMFLSGVNTAMVSRQGTAIGSAIELAMKSFSSAEDISKAVIIISDGENHEGNAVEIARSAAEKGINVYTIGIGLPEGVPIPIAESSYIREYRRDRNGNIVTTRLNEQMLMEIAQAGNGKYFRATSGNIGLKDLYSVLNKLEKTEMDARVYAEYEEQFPAIVWIVLGLLVFDLAILERKNKWLKNISLFKKAKP